MANEYIPALKYRFLTPYYDLVVRMLMPEREIRRKVTALLMLSNGDRLLDFGCGTGSQLKMIAETNCDVVCTGFDVDPEIIDFARTKVKEGINWVRGIPGELPFEENIFDRIVSAWVFHHLDHHQKEAAFRMIYKALKPGGMLLVADWGRPDNVLMRFLSFLVQLVDNFRTTEANLRGLLPDYMENAGFVQQEICGSRNTLFGTLVYYRAFRPAAQNHSFKDR